MVKLVKHDIEFILQQIQISEAHAAASQGATLSESRQILLGLIPNSTSFQGLRTVDGSLNNLVPGQELFGAQDTVFPRVTDPVFRDAEAGTSYEQTAGLVIDPEIRTITNLIVDQTVNNPAANDAAGGGEPALTTINPVTGEVVGLNFIPNAAPDEGLSAPFNAWFTFFGQFFDHGLDFIAKGGSGTVFIPLEPDDPLFNPAPGAPNFLILTRATNLPGPDGVVGDDPLTIGVDESLDDVHEFVNTDTPFVDQNQTFGENGSHQVFLRAYEINTAGEPVATGKLLNNRDLVDGIFGNGNDIPLGGMATWGVLKAQSRDILGIELDDYDVGSVPLIAVDQYGNFIPGADGFPQLVTADPDGIPNSGDETLLEGDLATPVDATLALRTSGNFLADIAHDAGPIAGGGPTGPGVISTPLLPDLDNVISGGPGGTAPDPGFYDNELLDAHFVTGDGRVNENIALTAVHHVFHAEHNRLVDETKAVLLGIDPSQDPATLAQQNGDITLSPLELLNSFLLTPVLSIPATIDDPSLVWNGERLFQTAKFGTEMQYQHLVFEEFARKIQPAVNAFESIDISIDPSITLEFSQAVYRFGHSMLTETVDRLDPDFASSEVGLIEAFLNPGIFQGGGFDVPGGTFTPGSLTSEEAAGALVRGLTRQVGNEIDEFVSDVLRNNLLGLPLDLAAINIARGRDVGIPPLNAVRADFFDQTGLSQLKPYESWVDFALHSKYELSVVNFIAAYGTHPLITGEDTIVGKRAAAFAIVTGTDIGVEGIDGILLDDPLTSVDESADNLAAPILAPDDAVDFLNSTGAWASGPGGMPLDADDVLTTGLGNVDLWIGGLAEEIMPFGGMLGSTFNIIFEKQLESLQDGDRFYYLSRTAGLNFLTELENNSFAGLIERNTDATHLPADVFSTPSFILEVDQTKQFNEGLGDLPSGTLSTIGQSGTVTVAQANATEWHAVAFDTPISNAVVAMMINTEIDDDPAVARVRNVTDTGFEFQIDEWDYLDGVHVAEVLSWIAISEGQHTLADGTVIHAGNISADNETVVPVTLDPGFTAPVVLTQVSTDGDAAAVTTRLTNVSATGFDVRLQEQESTATPAPGDGIHGTETIGWIAIEQGVGATLVSGTTGNTITDALSTVNYGATFADPVFLAQMQTIDGPNTAAVRGTVLGASSAAIFIEDETSQDAETDHMTENVGFVALGSGIITAPAPIVGAADPVGDSLFFDLVIRDDPSTPGVDTNYLEYTGGDHVVLGGTEMSDTLTGSIGDDAIFGDGGDDIIEGGDGADRIVGGDGDDIITDLAGTDNIKGGPGNDAIHAGNGIDDLVIGGAGSDFINLGQDPGEVFGGSGNDFIMVNEQAETPVFAGEGDDWIEGLGGVQISSGDNGALLVDSTIVGNDVFMGGDSNDDFDGESGDDIMVGGGGIDRMEGMIGFDWVTYFRDGVGVVADMNIRAFNENMLPPSPATIGDRFDQVEGLSGSDHADILIGDDAGPAEIAATLGVLTNFALIDGLQGPDNTTDIFAPGVLEWGEGNILLGGNGSDILEGRGGNDIIDGDSWLNVQLEALDGPGGVLTRYDSMLELQARVFENDLALRLNPGDISIVREILPGDGSFNFDTAVFTDVLDAYTIEESALGVIGDGDGDGYISVLHNLDPVSGTIIQDLPGDGGDLVRNIERLQFADQSVVIAPGEAGASGDANAAPVGLATIDDTTPEVGDLLTADVAGVTDADNVSGSNPTGAITGPVNFTWQAELDAGTGIFTDIPNDGVLGNAGNNAPFVGPTFTVIPLVAGLAIRVRAIYQDENGVLETVFSAPTSQIGGGPVVLATNGPDILNGTNAGETIEGLAGDDIINGAGGNDILIGGDDITITNPPGEASPAASSNAGNDILDGGAGTDVARFFGNAAEFDFLLDIDGNLEIVEIATGEEDLVLNIEILRFDDGDIPFATAFASAGGGATQGPDMLTGTGGADLINGLAGDDTINGLGGDDELIGGAGMDTLNGGAGADDLTGGTGDDAVNAGSGNDTIFWSAGDGQDVINGGTGTDRLRIQGDGSDETFFVETVADFVARTGIPAATLAAGTDIVLSRGTNGPAGASQIIGELNNIDDIDLNGGGGNDTFVISGDFTNTDLDPSTITITGSSGDNIVDISSLTSSHRIVFKSNGGSGTIIGDLRPQDVVELAPGTSLADYTLMDNGRGSMEFTNGTHTISFPSSSSMPIFMESTSGAGQATGASQADVGGQGNNGGTYRGGDSDVFGAPLPAAAVLSFHNLVPSPGETISGRDILLGTPGDDTIKGTSTDDVIIANAGNDIIEGDAGNDKIFGGSGNDINFGGDGDDIIFGEQGDDIILGEGGDDIIFGQAGNDILDGGVGADTIRGGAGSDTAIGGQGADIVDTGSGDDLVIASVSDGDDRYDGGSGIDTYDLSGTSTSAIVDLAAATASSAETGNDRLDGFENVIGGFGNDRILASNAVNVLTGGAGDDDFVFRSLEQAGTSEATRDQITDFQPGDLIDLSAIDANLLVVGNQSFELVLNAPTFTAAGEIKFRHEQQADGEHTILEGNVDGDDQADFQIDIVGRHDLTISDFTGVA